MMPMHRVHDTEPDSTSIRNEFGSRPASADELIRAMTRYPELIQRPVVIWADRAVIARPPELLLPLLETGR